MQGWILFLLHTVFATGNNFAIADNYSPNWYVVVLHGAMCAKNGLIHKFHDLYFIVWIQNCKLFQVHIVGAGCVCRLMRVQPRTVRELRCLI